MLHPSLMVSLRTSQFLTLIPFLVLYFLSFSFIFSPLLSFYVLFLSVSSASLLFLLFIFLSGFPFLFSSVSSFVPTSSLSSSPVFSLDFSTASLFGLSATYRKIAPYVFLHTFQFDRSFVFRLFLLCSMSLPRSPGWWFCFSRFLFAFSFFFVFRYYSSFFVSPFLPPFRFRRSLSFLHPPFLSLLPLSSSVFFFSPLRGFLSPSSGGYSPFLAAYRFFVSVFASGSLLSALGLASIPPLFHPPAVSLSSYVLCSSC